jgi:polyisoprenoid-binding protein YceI
MARFRVVPDESRLWAEARSSLHPIHVETAGLTGTIEADVSDGKATLRAPFRVEIDAERLRSGNGLVDGELQRRLETRKFPRVIAAVREVTARDAQRLTLRGELTLHGVSQTTDAEVSVRVVDDDTLEIEGEKVIDMQDYGLTPPKLLMFRVFPEVKVRARLRAKREG